MTITTEMLEQNLASQKAETALALPAFMYLDPAILELEKKHVLEASWQLVGHVSQLNKPGDHIVAEINDKPIIVVLTKELHIKAYFNVCRHRGGPLAYCNGHSNMLTCKYHGWTYTLDGQLKAAPEMRGAADFSVNDYQLSEVTTSVWEGLIFVNITNTELPSLDIMFADIAEQILPVRIHDMQYNHRDEYVIACNWKVYMDNYLEGYHIPHIHPELNKILDYRTYQTHCYDWYSYQFSPVEQVDNSNSPYTDGKAHYYSLWPNMMLNILPGRLQTNIVVPMGPDKCKVIFDSFYLNLESEATQAMIKKDQAFSDDVQKEDVDICERVQKGLASGAYTAGRLCMKRESGVYHFQELLRKTLREALS